MRALTVTRNQNFELLKVDIPKPKANEVLVKIAYVGICGSDLSRYFDNGVHNYPQVLGHEFSGVIADLGSNVDNHEIGEKVTVAPLVPCYTCDNCQKGEPAMCTQYSFIGSREPGAMADYVTVNERNIVRLPETLSLKEAAMVEPLTVAIHGVDRFPIKSGAITLVLGCGTIGLLTIGVLKARGASKIIAVDINPNKLKKAKELGATEVIDSSKESLDDYFKRNRLPEYVYETAGSSMTQVQAIKYVAKLGYVVYIGNAFKEVVFESQEFDLILRGELNITGSWMSYSSPFPGYEWRTAVDYINRGLIPVAELITGIYELEDMEKGFEAMVAENSEALKIMYRISGDD